MRHGSSENFSQIPVRGLVPEANSTPPASPVAGQLWTDTSTTPAKVRWYDGVSAWIAADGSSIPAGHITNTMISASAGIALSKLATDPLARANHTGTQAASTISDFDTAVRTSRLDQLAVPTGPVDVNGQRITNLAAPVSGTDAATKAYADGLRAGISAKDPVRVVAQANVNLAAPGAAIDGVTLTAGDRFLAPVQSTGSQNGLYTFNGAATAATRTTDADAVGEVVDGTLVAVAEGTDAGKQYIQRATASGAPGTWTQDWGVFSSGGQTYTAGTGLDLTGTVFSLVTPVPVNLGGTGATTAAGARTALAATGKYAADLGALTAGVTATITHNLGTKDVVPSFRTTADDEVLALTWRAATVNTVTVHPDLAYAAGAVRAVVVG